MGAVRASPWVFGCFLRDVKLVHIHDHTSRVVPVDFTDHIVVDFTVAERIIPHLDIGYLALKT